MGVIVYFEAFYSVIRANVLEKTLLFLIDGPVTAHSVSSITKAK